MTKRLEEIFSNIPVCEVFADIGCDHGYISKAMLDTKRCKKLIVSDISEKCLSKAATLLKPYIDIGVATAIVSDGFDNLTYCDVALISGMGGEEIVSIASKANELPNTLILQPMKNCDKVRAYLVENGYAIKKDYVFIADDKFYDLIVAIKGDDVLSDEEKEFGRTNLKNPTPAFRERILSLINGLTSRLENPNVKSEMKEQIKKEIARLNKYV